MTGPTVGQPRRFCPHCRSASTISAGEALWPAGWSCRGCGTALASANGFTQLAPDLDDVDEGFDREAFRLLAPLEVKHFWFVSRNELLGWLVGRHAASARRVLEVGTGTGFVLKALRDALPRATIAGSELHTQGLLTARERYGDSVELFQMDARRSHIAGALDLIGAFDVLEHIPEDEAVLAEFHRMLAPSGILIATVPQHPWMWSTTDDLAHHQRRYRVGELARKARAAGFEVLHASSFTTLAFPLMVASRLIARAKTVPRTLEEQTQAELVMSPLANSLMLTLARFEHRLRRLGMPMPFGGSQFVVARRGGA
mgnify:CR=1 FL=1